MPHQRFVEKASSDSNPGVLRTVFLTGGMVSELIAIRSDHDDASLNDFSPSISS